MLAKRYMTVIPEIDLPGHMMAAIAAYPDLSPARVSSGLLEWFGVSRIS